jgi:hypothetical protein
MVHIKNMVAQEKDLEALRERLDSMFSFASQVPYNEDHLLPVIQSCKSLIGIDLNHQPRSLLKWLDNYVKNFIPNFTLPSNSAQNAPPEAITYTHLADLIINKKESESNIYLGYLLQVADPQHIAEFLLELGAKQSPGSLLFCWSAFRNIKFLSEQNGYSILYHCLSKLLEIEVDEKHNSNLFRDQFVLYCYQFHIRKTELIRKNKIIPTLNKMILKIEKRLSTTSTSILSSALVNLINTKGEKGIVLYLSTLKLEEISPDSIMLLDALRSVLKFSDNLDDPVLQHIFKNSKGN